MQIHLKPSYRKMIMRAARPTENTLNEVIVSGAVCNPVSYDVPSSQRYKIKDYSLKSNFELKDGNIRRI